MQSQPPPNVHDFEILRRHGALVAVRKPAGMLVHNSDYAGPPERTLKDLVAEALGHEAWPAHRLDRQTSGVVLFADERERLGELMGCLREDGAEKTYVAVVRGLVRGPLVVDSPLTNKSGHEVPARTRAHVLATDDETRSSLLAVVPETGRIHQIRRHLRRMNHPLVNDAEHGDTRFSRAFRATTGFARLGLHALSLSVTYDGARHHIVAPLVDDMRALIARVYGEDVLSRPPFAEPVAVDDG